MWCHGLNSIKISEISASIIAFIIIIILSSVFMLIVSIIKLSVLSSSFWMFLSSLFILKNSMFVIAVLITGWLGSSISYILFPLMTVCFSFLWRDYSWHTVFNKLMIFKIEVFFSVVFILLTFLFHDCKRLSPISSNVYRRQLILLAFVCCIHPRYFRFFGFIWPLK